MAIAVAAGVHPAHKPTPHAFNFMMNMTQLEELNMENSRLVNPELEHLRGIVQGLKAEVIIPEPRL